MIVSLPCLLSTGLYLLSGSLGLIPILSRFLCTPLLHPYILGIFDLLVYTVATLLVIDASMITATSVSLSWTSAGSDNVSYEVMWQTDDIGGCSGGSNMNSAITTEHYIDIIGLEEDSSYSILVRAFNSAGSSVVSEVVSTTTLEAGKSQQLRN